MKNVLFTALLATVTLASQAQVGVSMDFMPNTTKKGRDKREKQEKEAVASSSTDYKEHIPTKEMMAKVSGSTFTDVAGKEFKLGDIKKKIIILEFWESWCKPCVSSMNALDKIQKENDSTVTVVAVNSFMKDTDESFKKYIDKHSDYSIKFAKLKNLIKEMDVHSVPFKMFIDENGNCIAAYEGVSENAEKEYDYIKEKIKPYTHK